MTIPRDREAMAKAKEVVQKYRDVEGYSLTANDHCMAEFLARAILDFAGEAVAANEEESAKYHDEHLNEALKLAHASGYAEAIKACEGERLIQGQTSVKFDPKCLQETREQPEVALRKMHNAAVQNCIDSIKIIQDEKPWEEPGMRGYFQMLICECGDKEHGHKGNIGHCERCECKKFIERRAGVKDV